MKIFAAAEYLKYLDCLVNIIKNHRLACLATRSELLLKDVTYVTWHDK